MCGSTNLKGKHYICDDDCGGVGCSSLELAVSELTKKQATSRVDTHQIFRDWKWSFYHYPDKDDRVSTIIDLLGQTDFVGHIGICSSFTNCGTNNLEYRFRKLLKSLVDIQNKIDNNLGKIIDVGDKADQVNTLKAEVDKMLDDLVKNSQKLDNDLKTTSDETKQKYEELLKKLERQKDHTMDQYKKMIDEIEAQKLTVSEEDARQLGNDIMNLASANREEARKINDEARPYKNKIDTLSDAVNKLKDSTDARKKQLENFGQALQKYKDLLDKHAVANGQKEDALRDKLEMSKTKLEEQLNRKSTFDTMQKLSSSTTRLQADVEAILHKSNAHQSGLKSFNLDKLENDIDTIAQRADDLKNPSENNTSETELVNRANQHAAKCEEKLNKLNGN
ncbi:hypothetical protein Ciccas_002995 [Cichlidogyrus casuarinus]|uniref:Uncharacterized protein n=1 Tax=Cichlidogyrus casuarinus TaxID=1844966 RepID=A0ABD2QFN7_9PLAT